MLRSLYSGVSGIKTHQVGMDVIGNNISNVNTTAFKSTSVSFNNLLSQNLKNAGAATETTTSTNPRQVGLGVGVGSKRLNIQSEGAAQTTRNNLDFRIAGATAFWIVREGEALHYTRDGSFNIDGRGDLVMANTGYYIYGWTSNDGYTVDKTTALGPLHIVNVTEEENENDTYGEPTTWARIEGTLDGKDLDLYQGGAGIELEIFNASGDKMLAEFAFVENNDDNANTYNIMLRSLKDMDGNAIAVDGAQYNVLFDPQTHKVVMANGLIGDTVQIKMPAEHGADVINVNLSGLTLKTTPAPDVEIHGSLPDWVTVDGGQRPNSAENKYMSNNIAMDDGDHAATVLDFSNYNAATKASLYDSGFNFTCCTCDNYYSIRFVENLAEDMPAIEKSGRHTIYNIPLADINTPQELTDAIVQATGGNPLDHFTQITANGAMLNIYDERPGVEPDPDQGYGVFGRGYATQAKIEYNTGLSSLKGDANGEGIGLIRGKRIGYMIDTAGQIFATYDNGGHKLLGQMAMAEFMNPTGLESIGNDCYDMTLNSGEARVNSIDEYNGKVISGQLEMSNVNLSDEMTRMIIMQRGFQANSRIVTVSDTMLEEVYRLKQ